MNGVIEAAELVLVLFGLGLLVIAGVEMIREERRPEASKPQGQIRVGMGLIRMEDDE